MTSTMTASDVFDREYLQIRAKLLELAAAFDRLDRSDGSVEGDPRLVQIDEGLGILAADDADKAARLQLVFSRQYDENWRAEFGV